MELALTVLLWVLVATIALPTVVWVAIVLVGLFLAISED